MGIIFKRNVSTSAGICLWEHPEGTAEAIMGDYPFSEKEKKEILSPAIEIRRKEILASKILIKELCGNEAGISNDEKGKPHLINAVGNISISHSGRYATAICEKKHSTGIDIQKITPKIIRIKEKFLSRDELDFVPPSDKGTDVLHVLWGAKECLFKQHGTGNLVFSENLRIDWFEIQTKGEINASVGLKNLRKNFRLHYEKFNNYMLVYIMELVNIVQ